MDRAEAFDPFDAAALRARVVVELAQNAADAAARAGERGVFRLTLTDTDLVASNTGAPSTPPAPSRSQR